MHKKNAALITPGTIDGDFNKLAEYDWVIEDNFDFFNFDNENQFLGKGTFGNVIKV